jgi:hypothetical protein
MKELSWSAGTSVSITPGQWIEDETYCAAERIRTHIAREACQEVAAAAATAAAAPCALCFINLPPEAQRRLKTRHHEGDMGNGCPKCNWLKHSKDGCLECVLSKAAKHELKQLRGSWLLNSDEMETAVAQCLLDVKLNRGWHLEEQESSEGEEDDEVEEEDEEEEKEKIVKATNKDVQHSVYEGDNGVT